MVFSQRYKELVIIGSGIPIDNICGEISPEIKQKLGDILHDFSEPIITHPNRYDTYEVRTSAFELSVQNLGKHCVVPPNSVPLISLMRDDTAIGALFTPYLFNLIEFQYEELSDSERVAFCIAISEVFKTNDIPWLLVGGRMIKIDAQQFELDLQQKALEALEELQNVDPKFQSAYSELLQSCTFLETENYSEAVVNAGNSYESVLKVICEVQKGNADKLTSQYITNILTNLPPSMTKQGFREKVMMALPFIRNNSASGHGAGAEVSVISKPLAKLAINLSAAMNTYLIEEYIAKQITPTTIFTEEDADEMPF